MEMVKYKTKNRTEYTKYREKMGSIVREFSRNWFFVTDSQFEEYGEYFLKTIKKDGRFRLYRYCRLKYDKKYVLDLEKLWCSCNGMMNDIFEGLPQDDSKNRKMEEYMYAISRQAYIKSFSETPYNNLMWAHYGDSYKGICIEYDICKLNDDNITKMLFPVYYTEERKFILETDSLMDYYCSEQQELSENDIYNIIGDTKGIFLQKANCWKYEREWRLCKINPNIDKKEEIEILFPCVSAIYIGPRIKDDDYIKVMECVKEYEQKYKCTIDINRIKLSKNTFDLFSEKM